MNIGKNALTVLERRYLTRDENNNVVETVEGMFDRVASAVAAADKLYNKNADLEKTKQAFYDMMTSLDFLPNSPTLMNAGKELGQLSACFVLPVEDSMEAIFEAIKQAALIHKSGGGTGFSFSRLRAQGSTVKTTGGVASGPVSFMRVFNMATEAVKQGGTRRGANMGILRVDHPDILQFIDCKKNNADITNFNISVGITEDFMQAVENGEKYSLIDPKSGLPAGELDAKEVFDKIVDGAWRNGEPGIIFLDRLNRDNVVPSQGEIESTNPCGEQPLLPYESCNLGSINLVNMIKTDKNGVAIVDYEKLEKTVRTAVHFLDNVIDVNKYPLDKIDFTTKQTRKIGLGVMGFADMLLYMGIGYNTDKAVELADKLMKFITEKGREFSYELAAERGSFPLFNESIYKNGKPLRNATVTTIAPTGTLSIIAGVSSGIEPVFAYVFIRNIMDNTQMIEVNPVLEKVLKQRGLYSDELLKKIAAAGSLAHIDEIPEDIKSVFVCSHDISPEYHLKMQAAFQSHTDNAVSKTVNFVNSATIDDVKQAYILAYKLGCKGVTIYRDGSRDGQVLNIGSVSGTKKEEKFFSNISPRPRADVMNGITERLKTGCGNLYVTVNYDEHGICEVFTSTGKAGGCPSQSEATARLMSIALRSGVSLDEVISQLRGIRCPSTVRQQNLKCTSCPDAIARVAKRVDDMLKSSGANGLSLPVLPTEQPVSPPAAQVNKQYDSSSKNMKFCPECGEKLEHEGGCVSCRNCGFSKCN
ncbi:MAG TPA: ribonucleotide-diphosphate reductase subunit alpha [Ruminococcaceae bacterium]|nr:ribonucleotide-diphosphate reductase subunit alpha [Oscillospiraceae bacterium]